MAEILVKPSELQQAAGDLLAHVKKLQSAIEAVDSELRALSPGNFEGGRAESQYARYSRIRERIFQYKPLIDHFAKDINEAAARFSAADKS